MAEKQIREAFEAHLRALDNFPSVWENRPAVQGFDANKAHQKSFMIPASNKSIGLQEKTTLHRGIFQVSLCYPTGIGAGAVEERAAALQLHFAAGTVLTAGGVKVRVKGKPSVGAPISTSPYVVPVSIGYTSVN